MVSPYPPLTGTSLPGVTSRLTSSRITPKRSDRAWWGSERNWGTDHEAVNLPERDVPEETAMRRAAKKQPCVFFRVTAVKVEWPRRVPREIVRCVSGRMEDGKLSEWSRNGHTPVFVDSSAQPDLPCKHS